MINLPHNLDMIDVAPTQTGYTFNQGRSYSDLVNKPTWGNDPFRDNYDYALILNKTSLQGLLPELANQSSINITVSQTVSGNTRTHNLTVTVQNPALITWNEYPNSNLIALLLPQSQSWQTYLQNGDLTITFDIGGSALFIANLDVLVTPYTRSFDQSYSERYSIIANFNANIDWRNLYLVSVTGKPSGLRSSLNGVRVEQIQVNDGIMKVVGEAYPQDFLSPSIDQRTYQFNKGGQQISVTLPKIRETA